MNENDYKKLEDFLERPTENLSQEDIIAMLEEEKALMEELRKNLINKFDRLGAEFDLFDL